MKKALTRIALVVLASLTLAACGGGDGDSSPTIRQGQAIAVPGADQSVLAGTRVTLDGSASAQPDIPPLTYAWTMTSRPTGSAAALTGATTAQPSFTPDVAGVYVIALVVNDGTASSPAVSVKVTAAAAAPVAKLGPAQNVLTGSVVTLDGSASSDANNDALTYQWVLVSRPGASVAELTDYFTAHPRFTADVAGTYVVQLAVHDGRLFSPLSIMTIAAGEPSVAPIANAGMEQVVLAGATVNLDGSARSAGSNDVLTYTWAFASRPAASVAALTNANSARPSFVADVAGPYVLNLVVNDGKINSVSSSVSVTAVSQPTLTLFVKNAVTGAVSSASFPYDNGGNSMTVTLPPGLPYRIASFLLKATGGDFTLANLKIVNPGSIASPVFVNFDGFDSFTQETVLKDGNTGVMTLLSGATNQKTADLQYSFTIKETGDTFTYSTQFQGD